MDGACFFSRLTPLVLYRDSSISFLPLPADTKQQFKFLKVHHARIPQPLALFPTFPSSSTGGCSDDAKEDISPHSDHIALGLMSSLHLQTRQERLKEGTSRPGAKTPSPQKPLSVVSRSLDSLPLVPLLKCEEHDNISGSTVVSISR